MSKIKVMDEILANKIAAGEVVEKMMNVVKELVENSIDAKSTDIKVELIDSGTKLIKVSDNGIGMDREDATLAFSRHATSKLTTLYDLFNISSLGFRGEALPSIASISKVRLKTSNGSEGTIVEIEGGKITNISSSDLQKGTDITVTDIFYNTPVRLKYIKNLYSELATIVDYVDKMALSYPNIKFTLINNDKVILETDGKANLLKVIYEIYGADISKKMVEINASNDDYTISGYMSYPEMARSNRNSITTLINGRVIKNNEIIKTITESYHTYMPKDKFPIIILNIDVDPILVDVNVHPTKMDVKFSKIDVLKDLIKETIQDNLKRLLLIPSATVRTIFSISEVEHKDNETKENNDINIIKDLSVPEQSAFELKEDSVSYMNEDSQNIKENKEQLEITENVENTPYKIKKMIPRGIVYKTYIIAENEDGMYIIDQHAAAERVNYEKCLKLLLNPKIEKINLLIPISLEFPTNEYLIIKNNLELLEDIGFEVEDFGTNTFVVRTQPTFIREDKQKDDILKIFQLVATNESFDKAKFIDHTAATMACRMSIKANDYINLEEAAYLLDTLSMCNNPFNCPHGRPTIITYTKYELEKMFKRVMD